MKNKPKAGPAWITAAVAVLGMGGCAAPYQPAPGESLATVRNVGLGSLSLCKDGTVYSLPATDGVAKVPAGRRVDLRVLLESEGYNVRYTCGVSLSFVPEANQGYVTNSGLSGQERCFMELVREDPAKETGVALERSLAAASCRK